MENYLGIIILTNAKILDSPSPHLSTSWRGLQSPCKALVALDLSGMSTLLCCVLNKGRELPFTARALREGRQAAGSWGNNEVLLCWCNSLSGGKEMLP